MNARLLTASLLVASLAFAQTPEWKDRPVLDTAASPQAVLHSVPVSAVTVTEGFWSPRLSMQAGPSIGHDDQYTTGSAPKAKRSEGAFRCMEIWTVVPVSDQGLNGSLGVNVRAILLKQAPVAIS